MLYLRRICVPLVTECNLHCKYCYRDKEKLEKIPDFTPDMISYLQSATPDWCEAVVASGGEPLLRWDKVQELFSYVPKNIHKKIMTNCTLLTQEMVDYFNKNEIELQISHDGPKTEFLRGVDVLRNEKIRKLIQQVKHVRCNSVVTKYNTNVWENYFDTIHLLEREDIDFASFPIQDIPSQHDMVDGFNYEEWFNTSLQYKLSPHCKTFAYKYSVPKTSVKGRLCGFNVLPNGIVCGMVRICSVYGSIHSKSYDECRQKMIELGDMDECLKSDCKFKETCRFAPQSMSEHSCKCRRMVMEQGTPEKRKEVLVFLSKHLGEIEAKYGYVKK